MTGTEGGKAGVLEVGLGKLAGADPEGPNTGPVGAYLTGSALKARPCHIIPRSGWHLVGLWTDCTPPLRDLGQVLPLPGP